MFTSETWRNVIGGAIVLKLGELGLNTGQFYSKRTHMQCFLIPVRLLVEKRATVRAFNKKWLCS